MSRSPGLLGMSNQFHNPRATVRRRLQVQCTKPPPAFHQGCQGKTGSPPLEAPQEVVPPWSSPPSHRQLNRKLSHRLLVVSVLSLCQRGWSKHATQLRLLVSIHVPSRVQTVDLTRPQCKANLKPMLSVPPVLVQRCRDHNPSMIHDIIPPQISMACHPYRKVLSIGMVLRDTAFTILPDKGVAFSGTLSLLM